MIQAPHVLCFCVALVMMLPGCKSEETNKSQPTNKPASGKTVSGKTVSLPNGITAIVPSDATKIQSRPGSLRFMVASAKTMLDISDPPGDCPDFLEREKRTIERMRKDPIARKLNRIETLSVTKLGVNDALYSLSAVRTPKEVEANSAAHPVAIYLVCAGTQSVSVAVSQQSGALSAAAKALHLSVASSVSAP